MVAIAIVVLIDLIAPLVISDVPHQDTFLIGLSFGQMGAALVWACAAEVLTWRRAAICYAVAAVMALYYVVCAGPGLNAGAYAMILTIWAAHPTITLVLHLALQWFRHRGRRETEAGEQPPRFGVRHLLVASVVIAGGSLVVRLAVPQLNEVSVPIVVILVLQSAALALVAIELRRSAIAVYWQLGLLFIALLVGSFLLSVSTEWNGVDFANVSQGIVLSLTLVAPHLDRHTVRITLEPRDELPPKQQEDPELLTE